GSAPRHPPLSGEARTRFCPPRLHLGVNWRSPRALRRARSTTAATRRLPRHGPAAGGGIDAAHALRAAPARRRPPCLVRSLFLAPREAVFRREPCHDDCHQHARREAPHLVNPLPEMADERA